MKVNMSLLEDNGNGSGANIKPGIEAYIGNNKETRIKEDIKDNIQDNIQDNIKENIQDNIEDDIKADNKGKKKGKKKAVKEEPAGDEKPQKHSGFKAFLLIMAMLGGFGIFVWNMVGLVNNMRLDGQGQATNIVYEMQDLDDFMDHSDKDNKQTAVDKDSRKDENKEDTGREESKPVGNDSDIEGNDDLDALRQEAQDARNEAALTRQELKNAEDMLDASLQREAELQSQLDALTGND